MSGADEFLRGDAAPDAYKHLKRGEVGCGICRAAVTFTYCEKHPMMVVSGECANGHTNGDPCPECEDAGMREAYKAWAERFIKRGRRREDLEELGEAMGARIVMPDDTKEESDG